MPVEERVRPGLFQQRVDRPRGRVDIAGRDGLEDGPQLRRDRTDLLALGQGERSPARSAVGPEGGPRRGGQGGPAGRRVRASPRLAWGERIDEGDRHRQDCVRMTVEVHLTSYVARFIV